MQLHTKAISFCIALCFGISSNAQAHRMWLLPSTFVLSGEEQWVTVDGAISNDLFFPNHVPLSLDDVLVTAPNGSAVDIENAARGKFRSVFDIKLDQQGTYKIAETGSLYFASWSENGETMRRRGTLGDFLAEGLDQKTDIQFLYSSRRVETFVSLGTPTKASLAPTDLGLEMLPITHPNDILANEDITFRFIHDGEAAENLDVMIVKGEDRYRDSVDELIVKTNADGQVTFLLKESGRYWLTASVRGTVEVNGRELGHFMGYSATFEVLSN